MLTLKERAQAISRYLASLLPLRRVTLFNNRAIPTSIASTLTVDDVHDTFRAAEGGDVTRLFQLYQEIIASDSHLQGRFADRKEAVTSDTLSIQPWDKKNPDDVIAAAVIEAMIADYPKWENACAHLLDSVLWPVSLLEKTFRLSSKPGLRYELAELTSVPYQLLSYTSGELEILPTNTEGWPVGPGGQKPEEGRYIIHRGHLLSLPDNWGGPMRSIVFWWLLSMMDRDWWARFLDRYGGPFLVGKYDQADDDSRAVLLSAFQFSQKMGGLVISKETEVEIKQAAANDSGAAYQTFLELCNREKSKLILGETLSSDAQATGMNSGTSDAQASKRQDKRQSDARRLAATLRHQLFTQYLRINGYRGRAPLAVWGSLEADETEATGSLISSLAAGGLRIADSGLETISERIGLPIERMPSAPAPGPFVAFASPGAPLIDPTNAIAQTAAPEWAKTLRGDLAPIRDIIMNARTPAEAIDGVQAFCAAKFDPSRSARVMEEAMMAITANGVASRAR
ncbi:phage portal protein family protein [Geminisphaera colitermitum]|uniref:phage portal protein family protein n=1 Tax=Geminisphaera colitermitum TaxID=1148786 RepID=UPI000158CA89|nr:DUF935 family protein [Geminisphaera colitermitum]